MKQFFNFLTLLLLFVNIGCTAHNKPPPDEPSRVSEETTLIQEISPEAENENKMQETDEPIAPVSASPASSAISQSPSDSAAKVRGPRIPDIEELVGKWYELRDGVIDERHFIAIFFDGESYRYNDIYQGKQPVLLMGTGLVVKTEYYYELLGPYLPYRIIEVYQGKDGKKRMVVDIEEPYGIFQLDDGVRTNAEHKNRYVNSPEGLNVRGTPDINGEKIYLLPNKQEVMILEIVPNNVTIDGIEGHWALVETDRIRGWVFTGYLTEDKPIVQKSNRGIYQEDLDKAGLSAPYSLREISGRMTEEARNKLFVLQISNGENISSLDGIELFPNLYYLTISNSAIKSIQGVPEKKYKLGELRIGSSVLEDVSGVNVFEKLWFLGLYDSDLLKSFDISSLENLGTLRMGSCPNIVYQDLRLPKNISIIGIHQCNISSIRDVSPLFDYCTRLDLDYNPINEIEPELDYGKVRLISLVECPIAEKYYNPQDPDLKAGEFIINDMKYLFASDLF